ncbi:MAG: helix-turn-helix domain-containing protein [Bacteroidetes bacterium]|nr:helix-turn-helix domain-containing protein [Bacteroidota bacterium]
MNQPTSPSDFLNRYNRFVIPNLHNPELCNVASIENYFDEDRRVLSAAMKIHTGLTMEEYMPRLRIWTAGSILRREESKTICQVRQAVGMRDEDHFTKCFKREYIITPAVYRAMYLEQMEYQRYILRFGIWSQICPECGYRHHL